MKDTECRLRELEEFLLSAPFRREQGRRSLETASQLLASSFVEFGCSGKVYDKPQTLAALNGEPPARWEISNYAVTFLAPDVALATFRATKHMDGDKLGVESLRSSIWRNFDGCWKLVFHQGTLVGSL